MGCFHLDTLRCALYNNLFVVVDSAWVSPTGITNHNFPQEWSLLHKACAVLFPGKTKLKMKKDPLYHVVFHMLRFFLSGLLSNQKANIHMIYWSVMFRKLYLGLKLPYFCLSVHCCCAQRCNMNLSNDIGILGILGAGHH